MPDLLSAASLGVVEGLTEFIPVSTTGHLIIVRDLLGFDNPLAATFEIVIQLGAIFAVVLHYQERLRTLFSPHCRYQAGFTGLRGSGLLALTTMPAVLTGAATHGLIREHLFSTTTVALGLGLGGIAIVLAERARRPVKVSALDRLTWRHALAIGAFQCLALRPGTSRAASTIVGAMLAGVDRRTAAEYSFLAAIPVIGAAALFDLSRSWHLLSPSDAPLFLLGFGVAFASAWLALRVFLGLLGQISLAIFGWYRIGAALVLLVLVSTR